MENQGKNPIPEAIPHDEFGGYGSWDEWVSAIERRKGHKICAARNKKKAPCEIAPMPNGKCYRHGGASRRPGPNHPRWKHGARSRGLLPRDMAARVEAAFNDPELFSLRGDAALLALRDDELRARLTGGASPEAWEEAYTVWEALGKAAAANEAETAADAMNTLGEILSAGKADEKVWEDIYTLHDHKRRLSMTETKRLLLLDQFATAEQIAALIGAIEMAINECIPIPAYREALGRRLDTLLNGPANRLSINGSGSIIGDG